MSRNNDYKNHFDEDDDGEDLEITDADEAASDDQGREEAAVCLQTGRSVRGNGKYEEQHRRMWFRLAQKALALGRERREEAAASEKAEAAAEKARVAAEEKAERERMAKEAKQQHHRERFQRSMQESDERWAQLDEQTRRENAAWEADRPDRERREREAAATPRPTSHVRVQADDAGPVQRPPATTSPSNARTARPATKPAAPATMPASPTTLRWASPPSHAGSPPSVQPARQPGTQVARPQPCRVEPERRVVAPKHDEQWRASGRAPTAPAKRPEAALPPPLIPRTPTPRTPPQAPSAFTSPPTAMLTGADLAAWRGARGLTQRPAANLLCVAPSTVAKAELLPGKVLGEQLQVALAAALSRYPGPA